MVPDRLAYSRHGERMVSLGFLSFSGECSQDGQEQVTLPGTLFSSQFTLIVPNISGLKQIHGRNRFMEESIVYGMMCKRYNLKYQH